MVMESSIVEALTAISNLNKRALDSAPELDCAPWTLQVDSEYIAILFSDQLVWSNVEEERAVIQEEGPDGWPVYEPLESYCLAQARKLVAAMQTALGDE